jgi:predicted PurR-regulated permease PerM
VITQAFTYTARTVAVRMLTDAGTVVTRPFLEQVLAGAVMAALVRVGIRIVGREGWHVIVVLVGFGGVIYFGALLAFSSYFRSTIRGIYSDFREQYRIV